MSHIIERIASQLPGMKKTGEGIDEDLALVLGSLSLDEFFALLSLTDQLRRHFRGREIALCAIANAKSGKCPENCAYCAQSSHYRTAVKTFPLVEEDELLAAAARAKKYGVSHFSVVTSGTKVAAADEIQRIRRMIAGIKKLGMGSCASLGFLDAETARAYRDDGLDHYHHNLETAKSFFPEICTTHTYDRAVETVKAAKDAGMYVCSGGIIGMGENWFQRVELALTLKELQVDSIPLNFLQPVAGTPLGDRPAPGAFSCLLTIAMFRLVCPTRDIRICGGRERNFPDAQAMLFAAGANGVMVGDYLTTSGRQWGDDQRFLREWGG